MNSSTHITPPKKTYLSRRSIVLIIATLLLHWLAIQSTGWKNWSVNTQPTTEKIIHVSMPATSAASNTTNPDMKIQSEKLPDTQKTEQKILEKHAKRIAVETSAPTSSSEIPSEKMLAVDEPNKEVPPVSLAQEDAVKIPALEAAPVNIIAETPQHEPAQYAVRAPGSVQIEMKIVRTKPDTNPTYGLGSINWEVSGSKYSMRIEAGIDMLITSIKLYKLSSEGRLDAFGITPVICTEARLTRASTATHFNYEDKTIRFSSSNKVIPMNDGAQDKASFLMQLAAIGNANEQQFIPGQEIRLQVAEERDASQFQFLVLAKEEITTELGAIQTWHLVRAPRPGSYNSQLDIWLAPEFGWYPVQIRNTESNGTVTLQTATKILRKLSSET